MPDQTNLPPKERIRKIAPKFVELQDDVLFGDVWARSGLSQRDRSLITITALAATYRPEQIRYHLQKAKENGITAEEMGEWITHLAFYAGWPALHSAALIAAEIYADS